MKKSVFLLICGWFLSTAGIFSQQTTYEDVIYLKDGSVFRGQIVELKIGEFLKLRMQNGSDVVLPYIEIEKIEKISVRTNSSPSESYSSQISLVTGQKLQEKDGEPDKFYLNLFLNIPIFAKTPEGIGYKNKRSKEIKSEDGVIGGVDAGLYFPILHRKVMAGLFFIAGGGGSLYRTNLSDEYGNEKHDNGAVLYGAGIQYFPLSIAGNGFFGSGYFGVGNVYFSDDMGDMYPNIKTNGKCKVTGAGLGFTVRKISDFDIGVGFTGEVKLLSVNGYSGGFKGKQALFLVISGGFSL